MERYWDLSEYDRSQLTAEQMDRFIAIECMERGVERPVLPAYEAEPALPGPDKQMWKAATGWTTEFYFETREEAEAFIAAGAMECTTKGGISIVRPVTWKLSIATCYSEDLAAEIKSLASEKERIDAANKEKRECFDRLDKAYSQLASELISNLHLCRQKAAEFDRMHQLFQEYVALCDGDTVKALEFLRKAKGESVDEALNWNPQWQSLATLEGIKQRVVAEQSPRAADEEMPF